MLLHLHFTNKFLIAQIWDIDKLTCVRTLTEHAGAVQALASYQQNLFSASDDGIIKVTTAHNRLLPMCTFSTISLNLIAGQVWDMGSSVKLADMREHSKGVETLMISDGRLYSAGDDAEIIVRALDHWCLNVITILLFCSAGTQAISNRNSHCRVTATMSTGLPRVVISYSVSLDGCVRVRAGVSATLLNRSRMVCILTCRHRVGICAACSGGA